MGCSSKSTRPYYTDKSFPLKSSFKVNEYKNYERLYEALKAQYIDWKGVRYKYGGNSKKGIDCSAFVQKTTKLQSSVGENISMEDLRTGDLVFFKTGFRSRHVGIYLDSGKFLHASTKRGVTISRLDNVYYSKHFWKIKRLVY